MPVVFEAENGELVSYNFAYVHELLRKQFIDDPLEFFVFLNRFKPTKYCIQTFTCEPSQENYICFRTMFCELFYNAVNSFDVVDSYTITCKNNVVETSVIIGHQKGVLDDWNMPAMAIVKTSWGESWELNYFQIHDLYMANKARSPEYEYVNTLMAILYMNGDEPTIKTSYTIRKDNIKTITKN